MQAGLTSQFDDRVWEDKAKDDVERGKRWLEDAGSREDKRKAQEFIEQCYTCRPHDLDVDGSAK
jgi:hypothetical protein